MYPKKTNKFNIKFKECFKNPLVYNPEIPLEQESCYYVHTPYNNKHVFASLSV